MTATPPPQTEARSGSPFPPARIAEGASALLLCVGTAAVFVLQRHWGFLVFGAGALMLLACSRRFLRDISLLYLAIVILFFSDVSTDLSTPHMLWMGPLLLLTVIAPYAISRYVFGDATIRYPLYHRRWTRKELLYILLAVAVSYFLLPFYLQDTGAWRHWSVGPDDRLIRLFIGTNGVGLWDELFFINTVYSLVRPHFSFAWSNLIQAVLFTSFLYELGFIGWGIIMIFGFALLQGFIYRKSGSLLYLIAIHLSIDLILYFALVNAHVPWLFDFFPFIR